jgi:putative tricarboxylic transport membrane protein
MLEALALVAQPMVLLFLLLGVLAGVVVGTLPGLSATMAVAILTPLTFWLPKDMGFAMLLGVYNSTIWSGGISAILINTPGTPASIAQTFDGYQMAKKGQAGLALGINTIYSVAGGLISTLVLLFLAFPLARFALRFEAPEYCAIGIFGLSMMISVSEKSPIKGLIIGTLGLLIATVGMDPIDGFMRFTFGSTALVEGLSFITIMIGVYGIGEILNQIWENERENKTMIDAGKVPIGRILPTWAEVKRTLPGSGIAAILAPFIGVMPGTGGDIASLISWDQAKRVSKHPEEFGKGSIEGIAATSLANNGVIGGALTTMLTLGIPGDSVTAVLLGSLMMYGLIPGPRLFAEQSSFVYLIILLMVAANVLILIIGLLITKVSYRILNIPKEIIWVSVLVLCVVGSYAINNSSFDVYVTIASGFFGFLLRRMGFPIGPLILGILMGDIIEPNLRRTLIIHDGNWSVFLSRPITFTLILISVLSFAWPALKAWRKKISGGKS